MQRERMVAAASDTRGRSRPTLLVALAVVSAGCAAAAPPRRAALPESAFPGSPSWSALANLSEGQSIVIGVSPGANVPGSIGDELAASFLRYDPDTLTVRRGTVVPSTGVPIGVSILPRNVVRYVKRFVEESDPLDDGTIKGLLIGAGSTAAVLALLCTPENDCPLAGTILLLVPPTGLAGAFWGRSIDRSRTNARLVTIYQAR